ncbi:chemotaxis protein CheY [Microbacterium sp. HD4P20]|uniref:chemotaxis protein CheY n=1 Tax=Microbacterium sp. HD4P20 TaxID=2864874 RepID=UPI001C644792|nr:chemotaxis protein CheY [Microbacterium sp. HD4P20]MCP2637571.1 chemotaxis protein CheY [Microbacterium sp. HD4P20]
MPRRDIAWTLLRELLPARARLRNPCTRCGGPHGAIMVEGAPSVAGVSYAGDLAVVAVAHRADGVSAIGIDAELDLDPRRDAAGLRGVLGGDRDVSVREWTRVEAALKADGRGLRVDPALVRVDGDPDGWIARVPGGGGIMGWDAAAPAGVTISVAVLRLGSSEVSC